MAVCLRRFFARQRLLASENDLNEFANTFCRLGPDSGLKQRIAYKLLYNATPLAAYLTIFCSYSCVFLVLCDNFNGFGENSFFGIRCSRSDRRTAVKSSRIKRGLISM